MATRSGMQMHTNIVMGSFLKGTDALYTSFGKINREASKAQKINMFKATNFAKLNSNLVGLDKTLGRVESRIVKMNRRPLDFGLGAMTKDLKTGLRLSAQIEKNMSQTAFKSRMNQKNSHFQPVIGQGLGIAREKDKNHVGRKIRTGVGVGVGLGTASVIGLASSISPIRSAIMFETDMAEVAKATNSNKKQTSFLSMGIFKEVNKGSLLSPFEIAKIQAGGGTAGVSIKNLPSFTKDVKMGAVALNLSTEKVGFVFADLAKRLDLPIKKLNILTNSITALENAGTVRGSDILNISSKLSSSYGELKWKPKNAMAVSAFTRMVSSTNETAESGFKTFIAGLQKTNQKLGYFDRLKENSSQLRPIIEEINSKYTPAEISKKFGGMAFQRSVSGMHIKIKSLDRYMAVVGTKQQRISFDKKYNPDKKLFGSGTFMNAVAKEYEIKLATTGAKEIMAKNRITASSIVVGDQLKKPYVDSLNAVSNGMQTSTVFYNKHKALIDKLGMATTGVLGATLVGKGVSKINPFPKIAIDLGKVESKAKLATKSVSTLKNALQTLAGVAKRNPIVLGGGALAGGAMLGLNHMAGNAGTLKERQESIGKALRSPTIGNKGFIGTKLHKNDTLKNNLGLNLGLNIRKLDVESPSAMTDAQISKANQTTNNNQRIWTKIKSNCNVLHDGSNYNIIGDVAGDTGGQRWISVRRMSKYN